MLNSRILCGCKPFWWERQSESKLSTSPVPAKVSVGLPAKHSKTHLGILTFWLYWICETQLCIYSLDELTQLRDNPLIYLSCKIQNPFLERRNNEAFKRPDRTVPLPSLTSVVPVLHSHSGLPTVLQTDGQDQDENISNRGRRGKWRGLAVYNRLQKLACQTSHFLGPSQSSNRTYGWSLYTACHFGFKVNYSGWGLTGRMPHIHQQLPLPVLQSHISVQILASMPWQG